jgi:DNA-directed RNA polymerase specialized sigma24 family protein
MNQRRAILEMHERGNSYSEISVVLGIPRSTCNDIVRRFGVKGDLRNRHSHGRP